MGRISDIYKNILMELQVGYNNLNATEDEYEKVGYQYQIKGIKEKITYANNVLKNIFTKEQLEDICKQVLSAEDFDKTINDLNTKNEESLKTYTERIANKMKTTEESLTVLLQKNPGCVQEDNKKHKEYLNLLDTKNKCQEALDNPRHKVYTIFDILSEQNLNAFFIKGDYNIAIGI